MSELGRLSLPTVKLVGIDSDFQAMHETGQPDDTIGQLWAQLMSRIPDLGVPMHWMIGVTAPSPSGVPGAMRYFAGMVVEEQPTDLHGLRAFELEGCEYVTYEHHGDMSTMAESFEKFYGDLWPNSGLRPALRPHLEIYDERFTMDDASIFRFAIPIEPGQ